MDYLSQTTYAKPIKNKRGSTNSIEPFIAEDTREKQKNN